MITLTTTLKIIYLFIIMFYSNQIKKIHLTKSSVTKVCLNICNIIIIIGEIVRMMLMSMNFGSQTSDIKSPLSRTELIMMIAHDEYDV